MNATIESMQIHGLDALKLTAANGASAIVTLFGAQVLSWKTPDGEEQLFLSERARFDGSPIRGGVPVCFPQFSGMGPLPKHGFVRTMRWTPVEQREEGGRAVVKLAVTDDAATLALWPHRFRCELEVSIEDKQLDIALKVFNTDERAFEFTSALHTYFAVKEIGGVSLTGLRNVEYRDAANGNVIAIETDERIRIDGEIDRVFHAVTAPVVLIENQSELVIGNEGFADAVVWNPGPALCAKLNDMAPDGYQRMLCVEAGAVQKPVTVQVGGVWRGAQRLQSQN